MGVGYKSRKHHKYQGNKVSTNQWLSGLAANGTIRVDSEIRHKNMVCSGTAIK
jgi:hypothetical protein